MAGKNFLRDLKKDPRAVEAVTATLAVEDEKPAKPVQTENDASPATAHDNGEVINTENFDGKAGNASIKKKRKPGRPKIKQGEYKTVNISIRVDTFEKMQIAKIKYSDNMTKYINAVIEEDLNKNFEKYKEIYELMKG